MVGIARIRCDVLFCTYCGIPSRTGRIRSLHPQCTLLGHASVGVHIAVPALVLACSLEPLAHTVGIARVNSLVEVAKPVADLLLAIPHALCDISVARGWIRRGILALTFAMRVVDFALDAGLLALRFLDEFAVLDSTLLPVVPHALTVALAGVVFVVASLALLFAKRLDRRTYGMEGWRRRY